MPLITGNIYLEMLHYSSSVWAQYCTPQTITVLGIKRHVKL